MALRVLLVDDEEDLVTTMASRLSFRDIEALYATSSEEAMAMIREHDFDVVVLDLRMPGLCGPELLEQLRQVKGEINCIYLTGESSGEDYRACLESGASSFLVKPVDIEQLVSSIQEAAQ